MKTFTDLMNDKNLQSWDDAQRIVNYHLMSDHLQKVSIYLTEDESNKVFEWSFETAYDSENYCYNFDTVNYALLCFIRDNGFAALEEKMQIEDDSEKYNAIVRAVNNYCDLENDYRVMYSEGS